MALVGEVGADRELLLERGGDLPRLEAARIELGGHRLARQVRHVREHARQRQTGRRPDAAVVVLPALVAGIVENRVAADDVEGDRLTGEARRARQRDAAADALGMRERPRDRLVAAERAADDRMQRVDAEMVDEAALPGDHVRDRHGGKVGAVRAAAARVDAVRPGGAAAAAEHVGADDEPVAGVDRPARPDHQIPPARRVRGVVACDVRVATDRVADQYRTVAPRVHLAVVS